MNQFSGVAKIREAIKRSACRLFHRRYTHPNLPRLPVPVALWLPCLIMIIARPQTRGLAPGPPCREPRLRIEVPRFHSNLEKPCILTACFKEVGPSEYERITSGQQFMLGLVLAGSCSLCHLIVPCVFGFPALANTNVTPRHKAWPGSSRMINPIETLFGRSWMKLLHFRIHPNEMPIAQNTKIRKQSCIQIPASYWRRYWQKFSNMHKFNIDKTKPFKHAVIGRNPCQRLWTNDANGLSTPSRKKRTTPQLKR